MRLVLDCREHKLFEICDGMIKADKLFKDISLISKNLELGDIIIEDDSGIEKLIIERKSFDDLASSIKDGRYSEQSYRLNGYTPVHNHNIMYLLEGENINKHESKQLIYSSAISLNYYKGFSIFRSIDVRETAFIALNWAVKISKESKKKSYYNVAMKTVEKESELLNEEICEDGINANTQEPEPQSYCTVIKKKKNSNITHDNFIEIVLCQIPSVSSVTAIAIAKEFKTLNILIEKLKENKDCLNEITYQTSKNQKRKVSKACIKNIVEFLNQ